MSRLAIFILFPFSIFFLSSCASLVDFARGDEELSFLRGEQTVDVKFDYSDMAVGSYSSEEDYVEKKVKEKNEDEPGSGDQWRKEWKGNRESKFEPEFLELLNEYGKDDKKLDFDKNNDDANYLMIVETTFTEPGFNVGVARRDAEIDLKIRFVEKGNPENVLTKLSIQDVPGRSSMGYDFATGTRLTEAYAKAGKELGKYIASKDF
ncbi:MAG: hypothetical protein BRD50_01230 [Bacteroidetes bacterium SW_11_45_7]|nr:MAG: hypothetical protein BRD50_01230 [Bacteroidetes bacterium SW_11_45_7]